MNATRLLSNGIHQMSGRLVRGTVGLLLAVGLVGGAGIASAQEVSDGGGAASPRWRANFDLQMAHVIRQEPSLRNAALRVVIEQASAREALRLPQTTVALLSVIDEGTSQGEQLMAVQALSAIGPEHIGEKRYEQAMTRLYALAEEASSERVRGAAADVIRRYQSG